MFHFATFEEFHNSFFFSSNGIITEMNVKQFENNLFRLNETQKRSTIMGISKLFGKIRLFKSTKTIDSSGKLHEIVINHFEKSNSSITQSVKCIMDFKKKRRRKETQYMICICKSCKYVLVLFDLLNVNEMVQSLKMEYLILNICIFFSLAFFLSFFLSCTLFIK